MLSIPLPSNDMSDLIAWNLTRSGLFSVQLAYHAEWDFNGWRIRRLDGRGAISVNSIWGKI